MKRILSLVLSLLMLASLCTGIAIAEEPRVLTIGSCEEIGSRWFEYESFAKLQEELNIKIEYTYYNEDSFNAMLAGGDMPDIVYCKNRLSNILDNGLAMDVYPYLEQYAPNLLSDEYAAALGYTRETMGGEDQSFRIISGNIGQHNWNGGSNVTSRGYIVQWDYYKELGCPEINSDDDYIAVLQQMLENHPTADDGTPAYLMGVEKTFTDMGGYRACFLKDVALNAWSPYLYRNNIFTNDLVNCYTDTENSNYWVDMEFYNKIYRLGGFDIDSFTMTSDEYYAKLDKNAYMGLYYDGGTNYVSVPSSNVTVYANTIMMVGQTPTRFLFIPEGCENYDIALQFINKLFDKDFLREHYSGYEGEQWNYDENGVPALTEESINGIINKEDFWSTDFNGHGARILNFCGYNPAVPHDDGYPLNLALTDSALAASSNAVTKDFNETYGVAHWFDAFKNAGCLDWRNNGESIAAGVAEVPTDILRIMETCNDIMYTAMPSLIMAESDEEFAEVRDEVLASLAANGENDAWEWYRAAWDVSKNTYNGYLANQLEALGMEKYVVE